MKDIDTYDLSTWLQQYRERIVNSSFHKLLDECKQYRDIYDECSKMVDKHSFIATVTDGDAVRNSIACWLPIVISFHIVENYLMKYNSCM